MKDTVAGRGVVGGPNVVQLRELAGDGGLPVVRPVAGEDEVVIGEGGTRRKDDVASRDAIEGVDREGTRPVRRGEKIRVNPQGLSRCDPGLLFHPVGPDDLLRGGHLSRLGGRRERQGRVDPERFQKVTPSDGEVADEVVPLGPGSRRMIREPDGRAVERLAALVAD